MNKRTMIRFLLFAFLLVHSASAKRSAGNKPLPPNDALPLEKWPTLNGNKPMVLARGGYSGVFPESTDMANNFALQPNSMSDALYCDLQITKDGTGICHRDITLEATSTVKEAFPKGNKTYDVNGIPTSGWFAIDYTIKDLEDNVLVMQGVFSRTDLYDFSFPLTRIEVLGDYKAPIWLNVPYDSFYKLHKKDPLACVLDMYKVMLVDYISSPEIGFLRSIGSKVMKDKTKLIFQVPKVDAIEPGSKKEYGILLKDLISIKTFASGILVPKDLVWPVNPDRYLEPHTTLVADAHKLGLEVYVWGFANDLPASFNYSYDPVREYLQFVDQPDFAVDGILTDFPSTAISAINCFAHVNKTKPVEGLPLIISNFGASGVYPPSSELAYQQAVDDGADIIDCSVQMSKDGVPFCLPWVDIKTNTTAATTFMSRSTLIPEIQPGLGIFSFDLTASEIQSLKLILATPMETGLPRNPDNKNKGKIITLAEFLEFAKAKAVSGILINIENANYIASKKSLSVTDAVNKALVNATFDKQVTQQVLIQSDDTSVLSSFKNMANYKKVLLLKELISDVPKETLDEIKKFADTVNVRRPSIVTYNKAFITAGETKTVENLRSANISIYVSVFRNEYTNIPFDFFSDPYVEMHTYIDQGIHGLVTDYPATARAYKISRHTRDNCLLAVLPGNMMKDLQGIVAGLPPNEPPEPALKPADIDDPPLPSVTTAVEGSNNGATAPSSPSSKSGQPTNAAANLGLCLVLLMVISFSLGGLGNCN